MSRAGNVTITWTADQWRAAAVPAINKGLTAAAAVMADTAARNFGTEGGGVAGASASPLTGGPTSGRTRVRGSARYFSSPPGAFPGVRTGMLRNSVAFASPDSLGTPLHAAYGTAVKYGRMLEFGTSRMPARPWIVRSAFQARPKAQAVFVRTASAALKAGGLST